MTPDELRACADALDGCNPYRDSSAVYSVAAYLRALADAQPVAIVGEQRSGAWAGANTPAGYVWSPPSDSSTKMIFPLADLPLETKLYTRPAPTAPQAEPKRQAILGAIARAWCHPKNASKEMDVDLADAIVDEVLAINQAEPKEE